VSIDSELELIYGNHGTLDPATVVAFARANRSSALHGRFDWDNTRAAEKYRLWQARDLITEVEVTHADGRARQCYVSLMTMRGRGGYRSMVDVLSVADERAQLLAMALSELERTTAKYRDLVELAKTRGAISEARRAQQRKRKRAA